MNSWLFLSLLLGHVIADFYLQNDKYCSQKEEKKFRSCFLYVHSLLVAVVSWALVPVSDFRVLCLDHCPVTSGHWSCQSLLSPKDCGVFVLDQAAYLAILAAVATEFDITTELPVQFVDYTGNFSMPLFILAVLLCIKPANVLIKLVLKRYQIGETLSCENIKNAGALIGNLERILTIIFVIIGRYEAIGFIIAAKSILRFKDTDTAKTEYVLAGTFLSFGIALLCGLMAA